MINLVNGATKILGIIGYPVRHSLSPVMQNAALRACGLDYAYVPFEVTPEG
ncbi:MAG: shikimate dehydrogenase, partial [Desulfobacteraceae bacterium]|nr:shikimate dehydrogenase [Desulfobacteraceae bacterium]